MASWRAASRTRDRQDGGRRDSGVRMASWRASNRACSDARRRFAPGIRLGSTNGPRRLGRAATSRLSRRPMPNPKS